MVFSGFLLTYQRVLYTYFDMVSRKKFYIISSLPLAHVQYINIRVSENWVPQNHQFPDWDLSVLPAILFPRLSIYLSYLIQSNPIHSHLICGMEGVWIWMSWLKIRNRTTTCSCVAKVCRHYDHCGIWRQGMAPGALTVTNRTRGVLTKWEPTVMALYQL